MKIAQTKSASRSVWVDAAATPKPAQPRYAQETDVVVVGAGITGLSAAIELKRRGHSVTVIDADKPGFGTTGHSSAHASAIPDAGYDSIIARHGAEAAHLVADTLRAALQRIAACGDSCDWQSVPAYLYAAEESDLPKIDAEFTALREAGFDVSRISTAPTPVDTLAALCIEEQGTFHPIKYIRSLQDELSARNVPILARTLALGSDETKDGVVVKIPSNRILARHVVMATHYPWSLVTEAEAIPYRSYLVAMSSEKPLPPGLFWDTAKPYHYARSIEVAGQRMLLLGGSDHRTGYFHTDDWRAYAALEAYARNRFGATQLLYKWSAQLYEPVDGLPFVGTAPGKDRTWIATGYSGNGLAFGIVAGELIAKAIDGEKSPLLKTLSPTRIIASSLPTFAAENARSVFRMARDRVLRKGRGEMEALAAGEGGVFDVDGELIAANRTEKGKLIQRSTVCTHKGGIVEWNPIEQSWDCPIHGGRYARNGRRIEGPPCRGLRKPKSKSAND